jgi:hypothetical protein
VHDETARDSVHVPGAPLPQRTKKIGRVFPLTSRTVPLAARQVPLMQVSPLPQTLPQEPQLLLLPCRSTQTLLQNVCPLGQGLMQVPALQVCPEAQARPQPPQCAVLVWVLASQPLLTLPSQFPKFVAHEPTAQALLEHTMLVVFGGVPQLFPQAPQFVRLLRVSMQTPEQLVVGDAQVTAQRPPEHTCPPGHTVPQPPQLLLSVCRSRHEPEQLVCPVWHETTHIPLAQMNTEPQLSPSAYDALEDRSGSVALCARPEDIAIVVAGGPEAYHLTYLPSFSSSDTVTVAI